MRLLWVSVLVIASYWQRPVIILLSLFSGLFQFLYPRMALKLR
tara:strand:- start:945 stop:1073 length:129 start_codon:yes stop_codon:yes gene_type:complete